MSLLRFSDEILVNIFEQFSTQELIKLAALNHRFKTCINVALHHNIVVYNNYYHSGKRKVDDDILHVPRFNRCTIISQENFKKFRMSDTFSPLLVKTLRFIRCKISVLGVESIKEEFPNSEIFFNQMCSCLPKELVTFLRLATPSITGAEFNMRNHQIRSLKFCLGEREDFPLDPMRLDGQVNNVTQIDMDFREIHKRRGQTRKINLCDFINLKVLSIISRRQFYLFLPDDNILEEFTVSNQCRTKALMPKLKYLTIVSNSRFSPHLGFLGQAHLVSFNLIFSRPYLPSYSHNLRSQRLSLKQFLFNQSTFDIELEKPYLKREIMYEGEFINPQFC